MLLSRDGDGHTGYNMGNDCVDETVEDYLLDGDVPEDGDKDCGSWFPRPAGRPYTRPASRCQAGTRRLSSVGRAIHS